MKNRLFYVVGILLLGAALSVAYLMSSDEQTAASPQPSSDQGLRINP